MTLREALLQTTQTLHTREDLRDHARQDAQQLLEISTGLNRVQTLANPDQPLTANQITDLQTLTTKRLRAVPIQYLRGSQEFYGRAFRVTPAVLIPRPETELLIEEALGLFPDRRQSLRIADVGTGSGILAITLALEFPQAEVLALDISPAALDLARENAARLSLPANTDRIRFLQSDLLEAAYSKSGTDIFDLIVSNPPYIPLPDAPTLHAQVRDHEPHLALFGGPDGHDLFRRLIPQARRHLHPRGWLLLETAGRTSTLDHLLSGMDAVHYRRDLQQVERIAIAQAPAAFQSNPLEE